MWLKKSNNINCDHNLTLEDYSLKVEHFLTEFEDLSSKPGFEPMTSQQRVCR